MTQLILHSAWVTTGLSYGPALVADHLQLVQSSSLHVDATISNRTLLGSFHNSMSISRLEARVVLTRMVVQQEEVVLVRAIPYLLHRWPA